LVCESFEHFKAFGDASIAIEVSFTLLEFLFSLSSVAWDFCCVVESVEQEADGRELAEEEAAAFCCLFFNSLYLLA